MNFTEEEIATRQPVWFALADLFLDTDVTLSYGYIVRICAASDFTVNELEFILHNEVAPAVSGNLLSVAGEWAGFDEEWLVNTIAKNMRINDSLWSFCIKPLRNIGFKKYIREHWAILEPKIIERRNKT